MFEHKTTIIHTNTHTHTHLFTHSLTHKYNSLKYIRESKCWLCCLLFCTCLLTKFQLCCVFIISYIYLFIYYVLYYKYPFFVLLFIGLEDEGYAHNKIKFHVFFFFLVK